MKMIITGLTQGIKTSFILIIIAVLLVCVVMPLGTLLVLEFFGDKVNERDMLLLNLAIAAIALLLFFRGCRLI